jgi:hypothetical protein
MADHSLLHVYTRHLAKCNPAELTKFRANWSNGETTTHRKHEMLSAFFRFCQRNELIGKNPKARQQQLTAAVKRSWRARKPRQVAPKHSHPGPMSSPTMMSLPNFFWGKAFGNQEHSFPILFDRAQFILLN